MISTEPQVAMAPEGTMLAAPQPMPLDRLGASSRLKQRLIGVVGNLLGAGCGATARTAGERSGWAARSACVGGWSRAVLAGRDGEARGSDAGPRGWSRPGPAIRGRWNAR